MPFSTATASSGRLQRSGKHQRKVQERGRAKFEKLSLFIGGRRLLSSAWEHISYSRSEGKGPVKKKILYSQEWITKRNGR